METNRDFSDIFGELNAVGARYLLVGGYAVGIHSTPRYTKDLDLWVEPTLTNAARVYAALVEFIGGTPLHGMTVDDFATEGVVFQLGRAPYRIDILTSISGVTFKEAWAGRVAAQYGPHRINVIGRQHLIQNKRASGRRQDLSDVNLLLKGTR
jgi:hypothetical protein